MFAKICTLVLSLTALAAPTVTHAATLYDETLSVTVGQTLLLKQPNAKRVSAGDGGVIDVKVFEDTEEILLIGKAEGVTDLRIWSRDGLSKSYAVRVAGIFIPPPPVPSVELESTILIKAKLIEVKKSALRSIGVNWSDVANGPQFGTLNDFVTNDVFRVLPPESSGLTVRNLPSRTSFGTGNNYLGLTSQLDSMVNLLLQNGDARLLAEPTLTCINGGQADFLAGGELPIPIIDDDGRINVTFKQFGIILNIEPRASDSGIIRTKVGVEVSNIDPAVTVRGIPGFATRKTKTEMNVRSEQTMVVAGLYSSNDAKSVDKVPGLGEIPLIGELFKSRDFRRGDTELVVLVQPQIVNADSQPVKDGVAKYETLRKASDERLRFRLRD
jgi:pilus assembly protein CpaC